MQTLWKKIGKNVTAGLSVGLLLACAAGAQAATVAATGQMGGYSNAVLDVVVQKWQPKESSSEEGFARVMVSINGDGKVATCMVIGQDKTAKNGEALCKVVKKIGKFVKPPLGMPADVYLSFWSGKPKPMSQAQADAAHSKAGSDAMKKFVEGGTIVLDLDEAPPIPNTPVPPMPKVEEDGWSSNDSKSHDSDLTIAVQNP